MSRPAWRPVCLLALLLIGGCSSSGTKALSAAQACAELAAARCNLRSECSLPEGVSGVGFSVVELYGDLSTCLTREQLACTNGLSAPQIGNDATAVAMCVAAFETYSCADFFDNRPPKLCVPTGARADGAGCAFNGQCQTGYCIGTNDSACGTCGNPPGNGGDCSSSSCVRGDRCLAASSTCAAPVAASQPCDASHPCARGLTCTGENADMMTQGTCQVAGTRIGVPCGGGLPGCDSTRGLTCAGPGGAKTCVLTGFSGTMPVPDGGITAAVDAGAPGQSPAGTVCGLLPDGSRLGCAAGTCFTGNGGTMGLCQPFAADGAPCDTDLGPSCLSPARCVTTGADNAGTCTVPVASLCPT